MGSRSTYADDARKYNMDDERGALFTAVDASLSASEEGSLSLPTALLTENPQRPRPGPPRWVPRSSEARFNIA